MEQTSISKPTHRSDHSTKGNDYHDLNEINRLSLKEEILLLKQIKMDNPNALKTVVIAHQKLVVCIAKRFQDNGLTLHDLIIKGNRGLVSAAQHFDETRGFTFTSYAIWCIRRSILHAFVAQIKNKPIPLNKIGLITKDKTMFSKMDHYFQREPTLEQINGMLEFQTKIEKAALQPTSHHITNECFKFNRPGSCQPIIGRKSDF